MEKRSNYVSVENIQINNLKNITVDIPLNKFVVFSGKSGSGKSTLAIEAIYYGSKRHNPNVYVPVEADALCQGIRIPDTPIEVGKYLIENSIYDALNTLAELFFSSDVSLPRDILKDVLQLLHLELVSPRKTLNSMSLNEYNKCRLLKLLISSPAKLLIIDEMGSSLTYNECSDLIKLYKILIKAGYSIFAIEHSIQMLMRSDYIINMGPGAGFNGGEVTFEGVPEEFYKKEIWTDIVKTVSEKPKDYFDKKKKLYVSGVKNDNICENELTIPLYNVVVICGKTASGKTRLLDYIFRICDKSSNAWKYRADIAEDIKGKRYIRRPYIISQEPIGNNPTSTPATYTGIMDMLREIYFLTKDNEKKGLTLSDFSYNASGKCPFCKGKGYFEMRIGDEILFDRCEHCGGYRFNERTLAVLEHGKNIGEILNTTFDDVYNLYFEDVSKSGIVKKIGFIKDVGLGYLELGQPSGTLSGGESQRIKITKELAKKLGDKCLFILDSPSRGLHTLDVPLLMRALRKLVEKNNSVVIADNNPYVIKNADWVILLESGKIVYQGKPKDISKQYNEMLGLDNA